MSITTHDSSYWITLLGRAHSLVDKTTIVCRILEESVVKLALMDGSMRLILMLTSLQAQQSGLELS